MNKLYVIVAYGGEYDDSWKTVNFATQNLDKATAYVEKMKKEADEIEAARDAHLAEMAQWIARNPAPSIFSGQGLQAEKNYYAIRCEKETELLGKFDVDMQDRIADYEEVYWRIDEIPWLEQVDS